MASNFEQNDFSLEDFNFTPNRPKQKTFARRQFAPGFKADIIRRVENGEKVFDIASKEKINDSCIYRWLEKKTTLLFNETQSSTRLSDRSQPKFPKLEKALSNYVNERRDKKLGVSKAECSRKALELAQTLISNEDDRKNS